MEHSGGGEYGKGRNTKYQVVFLNGVTFLTATTQDSFTGDCQLGKVNAFLSPTLFLCFVPPAKHLVQTANHKPYRACWNLDASTQRLVQKMEQAPCSSQAFGVSKPPTRCLWKAERHGHVVGKSRSNCRKSTNSCKMKPIINGGVHSHAFAVMSNYF